MTEEEIVRFLREMIADYDPMDLDTLYWYGRAADALPKRLDADFLRRFLASLAIEQRVFVIGQLAIFGHREIVPAASALVEELHDRPAELLEVAIALSRCGDPAGDAILRALYRAEAGAPRNPDTHADDPWRCDLPVARALLRLGTPAALALRFSLITDGVAADRLDRDELARALRSVAAPIADDEEFWCRHLAPRLPRDALAAEFLDAVLAPLSLFAQTNLLRFLARIGRAEAVEAAARLTNAAGIEGFDLLLLGEALTRCRDARGPAVLEALYRRSVERRSADKDTVPPEWITEDVLGEEIGTLEAGMLRMKLLGLGRALRA